MGDTVTVNVLGRPLTATIANLRKIDWARSNFRHGFFAEQIARAAYLSHYGNHDARKRNRSDPRRGAGLSQCDDYPCQGSIGDGERHY